MPNWIIKVMARRFGTWGTCDYGMGFKPYGWHWRGYFVRHSPWPYEMAVAQVLKGKDISMRKWKFTFSFNPHTWGLGITVYPGEWASAQIGPFFIGYDNAYVPLKRIT